MYPSDLFTHVYNLLGSVIDKEENRNTLANIGQVYFIFIIKKAHSPNAYSMVGIWYHTNYAETLNSIDPH